MRQRQLGWAVIAALAVLQVGCHGGQGEGVTNDAFSLRPGSGSSTPALPEDQNAKGPAGKFFVPASFVIVPMDPNDKETAMEINTTFTGSELTAIDILGARNNRIEMAYDNGRVKELKFLIDSRAAAYTFTFGYSEEGLKRLRSVDPTGAESVFDYTYESGGKIRRGEKSLPAAALGQCVDGTQAKLSNILTSDDNKRPEKLECAVCSRTEPLSSFTSANGKLLEAFHRSGLDGISLKWNVSYDGSNRMASLALSNPDTKDAALLRTTEWNEGGLPTKGVVEKDGKKIADYTFKYKELDAKPVMMPIFMLPEFKAHLLALPYVTQLDLLFGKDGFENLTRVGWGCLKSS